MTECRIMLKQKLLFVNKDDKNGYMSVVFIIIYSTSLFWLEKAPKTESNLLCIIIPYSYNNKTQ